MYLDLDEEQRELREGIRRFCETRYPPSAVRSHASDGLDRERWADLGELGIFSLRLPESRGGLGLRHVDAAIAFEVLGAGLVPGPLVACSLAAGVDAEVAAGRAVAALVDPHPSPLLVDHLTGADVAYVLSDDGVTRVDCGAISFSQLSDPFDPATPVCSVTALPAGERVGDAEMARAWRASGSLLTSAMLSGIADAACRSATDYAKTRVQFGRPIGSFQALQHMLADSYAVAELARAAVYAAAATADDPSVGSLERALASARIASARAALDNAKTCIQVHGGMGFTWEADAHLLLKRARVLCSAFGSPDEAAETVARHLVDDAPGPSVAGPAL